MLDDAPLCKIAQIACRRTIEQIASYRERLELLAFLHSNFPKFKQAGQGFWAHQGYIPQWGILSEGTEILLAADKACEECTHIYQLADFIKAYTGRWWKIDAQYCYYHTLPESDISLAVLTAWVEQIYRRYLEVVNRSWTALLAAEKSWPPDRTLDPQWKLWPSISQSRERRAVFFIDALRYDVAQRVANELDKDDTISVARKATQSGLPSITPLGMASLLPRAETQNVVWEGGWRFTSPKSKGNLAVKTARENFLEQSLRGAVTLLLEELLQPQKKLPKEAVVLAT